MDYPSNMELQSRHQGSRQWKKNFLIGGAFVALVAIYLFGGYGGGEQPQGDSGTSALGSTGFTALEPGEDTTPNPLADPAAVYSLDDAVIGPADAVITIVEFSDFECPFCRQVYPTIKQVLAKYSRQARFQYRDFPLADAHPGAFPAAEAAECAGAQGKYWAYHDMLFENQGRFTRQDFAQYAVAAGVNLAQFNSCLDGRVKAAEVEDDFNTGVSLGVEGTPTFFINGRRYEGVFSFEEFSEIIDGLLR